MVLNIICNFKQRTEQVPVELDISTIEEYILVLHDYNNQPNYCRNTESNTYVHNNQ